MLLIILASLFDLIEYVILNMFLRLVKTNFQTSQIFPESPLFEYLNHCMTNTQICNRGVSKKNQQFRFIVKKITC